MKYWEEKIPFWEDVTDDDGKRWYIAYLSHHFILPRLHDAIAIQDWAKENAGFRKWSYSYSFPKPAMFSEESDLLNITHVPVVSFAYESDALKFRMIF